MLNELRNMIRIMVLVAFGGIALSSCKDAESERYQEVLKLATSELINPESAQVGSTIYTQSKEIDGGVYEVRFTSRNNKGKYLFWRALGFAYVDKKAGVEVLDRTVKLSELDPHDDAVEIFLDMMEIKHGNDAVLASHRTEELKQTPKGNDSGKINIRGVCIEKQVSASLIASSIKEHLPTEDYIGCVVNLNYHQVGVTEENLFPLDIYSDTRIPYTIIDLGSERAKLGNNISVSHELGVYVGVTEFSMINGGKFNAGLFKLLSGIAKPNSLVPVGIVDSSSFVDEKDGRRYKTTKVMGLTWMAENLKYKSLQSRCYGGDERNCEKYGRLYDYYDAQNSCPIGWHIPGEGEWKLLMIGTGRFWNNEATRGAYNILERVGFNVEFAGFAATYLDQGLKYDETGLGTMAQYWTSTFTNFRDLFDTAKMATVDPSPLVFELNNSNSKTISKKGVLPQTLSSVRCVKDIPQ